MSHEANANRNTMIYITSIRKATIKKKKENDVFPSFD